MRRQLVAAAVVVVVCITGVHAGVVIQTVPVGNPGNAPDTRYETPGYGGVVYAYNIGKYEVTAGQYTEFLNAVAPSDTYGLYNTRMAPTIEYPAGCNIQRTGSPGSYSYSVAADWADRPVNNVSWGDAARFANWLHNGQPTGAQDFTTTEDGAYRLVGATSRSALLAVAREPDATWVIPSEDEWYKAAFHKNDGVTGKYFVYPTSSDILPSHELIEPTDPGNNATYFDRYSAFTIGPPYYRTEVGAHENSNSPYGTFDQGGNVLEWNEAIYIGSFRGLLGGAFSTIDNLLHAAIRYSSVPDYEIDAIGFRVANNISSDCGNGVVEFGEECDDGNGNDNDYCFSTCERNWSVPTTSEWGLGVMLLVALVSGTLVFATRRRQTVR